MEVLITAETDFNSSADECNYDIGCMHDCYECPFHFSNENSNDDD